MSKNNGIKASFGTKSFRVGGYSVVVAAALIAIVVIVNLFVNALPETYTKIDASSNELYSISEETESIVSSINEDITVYLIAETGSEDTVISELLGRYQALNSHIKVKNVDPAVSPAFTSQYTDADLSSNSLIVVSALRSKAVDYTEIYVTSYSDEEIYNYYYYGTMPTGTTEFAGEGAVTGALQYVTENTIPTLYVLTGHGESSFDTTMAGYIKSDNIETADLSLLTEETVPSDASGVIVISPQSDINTDETQKLREYLAGGGSLILLTDYNTTELPNLFTLTSEYGASFNGGLVIEGNKNYYMSGYTNYLLPKIQSSAISSLITNDNMYVFLPNAHGITKSDSIADNITYSSLLKSSAAAFIKTDVANIETLEKQDGDQTGQYDLGVLLTDSDTGGKIVWFSSSYIINSSADSSVSGGNSTFFLSTLTYLCEKAASVSIASKSMQVAALVIDDLSANIWAAVIVVIVPAAILGGGFAYWYKRRRA